MKVPVNRRKRLRTYATQRIGVILLAVLACVFAVRERISALVAVPPPWVVPQDVNDQDEVDEPCDPPAANDGPEGGDSPCGMPVWRVSEPFINVWIHDTPLRYRLANGQWMELKLSYRHRSEWPDYRAGIGGFGTNNTWGVGWECNWIGALELAEGNHVTNYMAGGGQAFFQTNGMPEYRSGRRFQAADVGRPARIRSSTGAENHYDQLWESPTGRDFLLLSTRLDRYGRKTTYEWESIGTNAARRMRLARVIDRDGRTNTLAYSNAAFSNFVTSVTDPYGRSAHFNYDSDGHLVSITDMASMVSTFAYNSNYIIQSMTTPYGLTSFEYFNGTNAPASGGIEPRAVKITEADGSVQLYAYRSSSDDWGAGVYATSDGGYYDRNSYHWNRAQYEAISQQGLTNVLDMPLEDYFKATLKHWLLQSQFGQTLVTDTLGAMAGPVLLPEENGVRSRQVYYEYGNQPTPAYVGTIRRPNKVVWNGTSYAQGESLAVEVARNAYGRSTQLTFYINGSSAVYENTYAEGERLTSVIGPRGEAVRGYGYHAMVTNLLTSVTNAVGEVLRYTHDTNGMKVTSIAHPGGLLTKNFYHTSGAATGFLARTVDLGFRTNSFTYTNGNVHIHTNELGLVTTNTWDELSRLTSTRFPDGTYTSNLWDKLDLAGTRDRLGQWTRYGYNKVRQLMAVTNANGAVTTYEYCACGSPSALRSWDGTQWLTTQFSYDLAGRLTNTIHPDGYQITYHYDAMDRLTNAVDSTGQEIKLGHNEYDQITAVKVGSGEDQRHWALREFDEYGRLTGSTDPNGVTTLHSYDVLDRLVERRKVGAQWQQESGVEGLGYDARGLSRYTDELGAITKFARDELGRCLFQTNANQELLRFTYDPAGALLTLTDGRAQMTRWKYDAEGRVTNKLDAASAELFRYRYDPNGRLTNRWQAGGISTTFRYDAVGNLTNIVYPSTSNIVLRYDPLNRLTRVVDGLGTNDFSWTAGSQLAAEDGPWSNDTVSYSYTGRQRASRSVQQPDAGAWAQSYGHDRYWRLTNVTSPAGIFAVQYKDVWAGSIQMAGSLVEHLHLPGHSAITNEHDDLGRPLSTVLGNAQDQRLNAHAYEYNAGHQRVKQTFTAGNYVDYTYDAIGQLRTARGWESDTTSARWHEQFGYAYDPAWNLSRRTNHAYVQQFNVNNLNELTTASRAGNFTVAGNVSATPTNVTVNGVNAQVYADLAFARTNVSLSDGNNAFTAIARDDLGRVDTNTITAYLPATVTFAYDARGNLTGDGHRVFTYDEENQLTRVTVSNAWRSEFVYDGLMRRRIRKEYGWSGSAWLLTNEVRYVYDGMLVVQERNSLNAPQVTYTRGNDLSGTLQGAGGIGGLLARSEASATNPRHAYYHADGNGNVTALVNTNGVLVARYHYDPYGNTLAMSGPLAEANCYRFSSKEHHSNSGLYYYGFRFYEPSLQRWPNRDPLGDIGSLAVRTAGITPWDQSDADDLSDGEFLELWADINRNLYGAMGNNAVNSFDAFGLTDSSINACARSNPVEVGKLARELLDEVAKDQARRRASNEFAKKALREVMDKTKELNKHLDKRHLNAAREELKGKVVSRKPDGTPHDHLKEVREAFDGVKRQIEELKNAQTRDIGQTEREALQKQLDKLRTLHDRAQDALQCK